MFDPRLIEDPRLGVAYERTYLPLCDGGEAPPIGVTERIARQKLEFLALYYTLNRLYAQLSAIREGSSNAEEQDVRKAIMQAVKERDQLEDFYEPVGFLGEPVMEGIYYKNIEFTYAGRRGCDPANNSRKVSVFIPLPAPGEDLENWTRKHLTSAFPEAAYGRANVQKP